MKIDVTNAHLTRQLDLIPVDALGERITVIGAGAIGSFTVLSLAKMGFSNITVFDDDQIDVENMNCQFYRFGDIGRPKVEALAELVHDFTKVRVEAINHRYEGGMFPGIVISAVDSMAVRTLIWENHKMKSASTKAIIDPRMGAEHALMYVMNPLSAKDAVTYETTLYTDENAVAERCTAKATIYTATMLSGFVAKAVKDLVRDDVYPRISMWSIIDNDLQSFRSKKDELN